MYQDRIVDLLDRRYNLVVESPDEDFWLEIDRFMRFIQEEGTLKPFTNKMIRDEEGWVSNYEDKLKEEVADIEQIRQEFIAKYPNLDDTNVIKPTPNENIVELVNKDPYFKSFALFDELTERIRSDGPTIWSRTISPNVPDPTEAARLISLLEGKISEIPKVNFPEDIYLRLKYLREKHNHLRLKFQNECKVLPFASLAYLNELISHINPEPRCYKSILQWSSESVDQSIEQIIQPPIRDQKASQFHLRRVYEQLRSDIGSQLAHYELIQRFKIRCMFYDRKRIEELIHATKRFKEDALTRDLALYLFDSGISSLYRVKRGIHEYDLIASSLFVEAKVYSKSDKKRLIDGISQLHSYVNGLQADAKYIREIYYVMFRLGGPLYDWPEKIEMNRWTIYPVTIDLGPSDVSGSRQTRTVKIMVDEIYATLPKTDE